MSVMKPGVSNRAAPNSMRNPSIILFEGLPPNATSSWNFLSVLSPCILARLPPIIPVSMTNAIVSKGPMYPATQNRTSRSVSGIITNKAIILSSMFTVFFF